MKRDLLCGGPLIHLLFRITKRRNTMEIIKIIGIALIALIIIIMLKQYRPEYVIFISILTGVLILFLVMELLLETL